MSLASDRDTVIVVGDYNLPLLHWTHDHETDSFLPTNPSSEIEIALTETLLSAGLHQVFSIPNNSLRFIDLAFSNSRNLDVFEPAVPILPTDRHHKAYILCLDINQVDSPHEEPVGEFDFDFGRCDYVSVAAALVSTDWESLQAAINVEFALNLFYVKLYSVLKQIVPLKRTNRSKTTKNAWWNSDLRRLRNQLRKVRKSFNKNRTEALRCHLRHLENEFKHLNDLLYRQHISRLEENLKRDPSSFWEHFKGRKHNVPVPVDVSFNGVTASNQAESVNLFADFFQNVYCSVDIDADCNYLASLQSYVVNLP
ncbi:uncharacterized protein LOC129741163 [Uranotaenia lowii]|uniref:uncharacterized protein LOC129741163 n=1 Tax=Uranotaenia lowii TaxID=190385 RepID=UPI00247AFABE|nr:uncharacterized protein LOC129741163 [Uranotaenia lowii]